MTKNRLLLLLLVSFLFSPVQTFAAQIFPFAMSQSIDVDAPLEVGIYLDSQGEEINAVEGKILFSPETLELAEVVDAGLAVSLWVEAPHLSAPGEISFAGIVPGGFLGEDGYLFTLNFKTLAPGEGWISTTDEQVLLNDGAGSAAHINRPPSLFVPIVAGADRPVVPSLFDNQQPEAFTAVVASDPSLFDGDWFAVFVAQDKQSGIDHYLVEEIPQPRSFASLFRHRAKEASSPYRLRDQSRKRTIVIRAVDRVGNETVTTLEPQDTLSWYERYDLCGMMLLAAAFIFWMTVLAARSLWRKQESTIS